MSESSSLNVNGIPLHEQLREIVRKNIFNGTFSPENKLPSEAEFSQKYNISRTTVRLALNELVGEGLLSRKQGVGTFVTLGRIAPELVRLTDFVEDIGQAGLAATSKVVNMQQEVASIEVSRVLDLTEGTKVLRLERLRLGNNYPIAFDITWLPLRYGLLIAEEDLATTTVYKLLESKFDIPVLRGTYFIEACNASKELAHHLQVESGHALLLMTRISYADGNKAVYYQKRFIRSETMKYRISLERQSQVNANGQNASTGSLIREFVPIFSIK